MKKTQLIYDDFFLKHDDPHHPENANRLKSIFRRLQDQKLTDLCILSQAQEAKIESIELVHPLHYIEQVKNLSEKATEQAMYISEDTYLNQYTFRSALKAVGGLITLCENCLEGKMDNGFNLARPPGHHATKEQFMGFCFFSTVAIAAHEVLERKLVSKVAIVDFDVHQGNGTEDRCKDNPNILFISTHQKNAYPFLGTQIEISSAKGGDNIINCPLPAKTTTQAYHNLLEQAVLPALKQWQPEILIVSAGYDAHWKDPLADLSISSQGFGRISQRLCEFAEENCNGNIVFHLEGGYDCEALANSVENSVRALLGRADFTDLFGESPSNENTTEMNPIIQEILKTHQIK